MLKKTIEFEDLDGNKVTDDFYFNLSKAEIAELELSQKGGLSEYMKRIVEDEDGGEIISIMRKIIGMSVGIRSEDGRRFAKSDEIRNQFMQTDAYSVLFMEMVTNAGAAAEFIQAIVPADISKQVQSGAPIVTDVELPADTPAWIEEDRDPTEKELREMSKDEMAEAFRRQAERRASQTESQ